MIKQLCFLHIPKTGGRTMIELCRHFYRPDQCKELSAFEPTASRFVHGHFSYHAALAHSDYLAFTLLRDPAARVASYYQMSLRQRPEDWTHYDLFWKDQHPMSIIEFATDEILQSGLVRNGMVRQLARPDLFQTKARVTEGDVEKAIQNLQKLMVGFTEDYDNFVDRLFQRMGWAKPEDYPAHNQSMPYTIDTGVLEELRAINRYDCMLYEWAREHCQ